MGILENHTLKMNSVKDTLSNCFYLTTETIKENYYDTRRSQPIFSNFLSILHFLFFNIFRFFHRLGLCFCVRVGMCIWLWVFVCQRACVFAIVYILSCVSFVCVILWVSVFAFHRMCLSVYVVVCLFMCHRWCACHRVWVCVCFCFISNLKNGLFYHKRKW